MSTPRTDKQQSGLNYNRRAHINHTRNLPETSSSGDQKNYATVLHRIPTAQGHWTKTVRHSRSTESTYTNTKRQPKIERQRNMPKLKEQEKSPEKEVNGDKQSTRYRL